MRLKYINLMVIVFLISCGDEEPCPQFIEKDSFQLLEESKEQIFFTGEETLFFVDSKGDTVFLNSENQIEFREDRILLNVGYCGISSTEEILHVYYTEAKEVKFYSWDRTWRVVETIYMWTKGLDPTVHADMKQFRIFREKTNDNMSIGGGFLLNRRNATFSEALEKQITPIFIGDTVMNGENLSGLFRTHEFAIFFTEDEGLVGFEDPIDNQFYRILKKD